MQMQTKVYIWLLAFAISRIVIPSLTLGVNMDFRIIKYPRTEHLEGSRLQAGDEDLSQVPFSEILGRNIVIEEKIDGANCAISFDGDGGLLLQSRGHYLTGGYRERHYAPLKAWASANRELFYSALGSRYIMYGEWMYAKHTVFYDALPDYFMEFDILDRESGVFLDTAHRRAITEEIGIVSSVPVLAEGVFRSAKEILSYLGRSAYVTDARTETLRSLAEKQGLSPDEVCRSTDLSGIMEGLYVKVEESGAVTRRVKYVRSEFRQLLLSSDSHWHSRPLITNQLAR